MGRRHHPRSAQVRGGGGEGGAGRLGQRRGPRRGGAARRRRRSSPTPLRRAATAGSRRLHACAAAEPADAASAPAASSESNTIRMSVSRASSPSPARLAGRGREANVAPPRALLRPALAMRRSGPILKRPQQESPPMRLLATVLASALALVPTAAVPALAGRRSGARFHHQRRARRAAVPAAPARAAPARPGRALFLPAAPSPAAARWRRTPSPRLRATSAAPARG